MYNNANDNSFPPALPENSQQGSYSTSHSLNSSASASSSTQGARVRLVNMLDHMVYLYDQYPISIGRNPTCDLYLPTGSVSRQHAWLTWDERLKQAYIQDHSANGTVVNARPIPKDELIVLHDGDILRFAGSPAFEVQFERPIEENPAVSIDLSGTSLTGMTILGYKIIREIGRGGFSRVYAAARQGTQDNRLYCIKHMFASNTTVQDLIPFQCPGTQPRYASRHTDEKLESCEMEFNIISQLQHPQIVQVYERISLPSHLVIVMEMLDGPTLQQHIDDHHTLSAPITIDIGLQIAQILACLHSNNPPIIYRDLKPVNLIISREDSKVHLLDFGISQYYVPGKEDLNRYGTAGYAAPEQASGRSEPRTDLFALGITMFACLSGYSKNQISKLPLPIHPSNYVSCPADLDALIARLTEPSLSSRFSTAYDVIHALFSLQSHYGKPQTWFEED